MIVEAECTLRRVWKIRGGGAGRDAWRGGGGEGQGPAHVIFHALEVPLLRIVEKTVLRLDAVSKLLTNVVHLVYLPHLPDAPLRHAFQRILRLLTRPVLVIRILAHV